MTDSILRSLVGWPARRWAIALVVGTLLVVAIGIPTDLIANPVFGRDVPPSWWAWPALAATSALAGLVAATYVVAPGAVTDAGPRRGGTVGAALTYFAVGCPVCNKVVVLALGATGALRWFEPVQPVMQLAGLALLAWALRTRLRNENSCPIPTPTEETSRV